ncbi:MAG: hypothetical protein IRY83_15645 [Chloroflexi bacterium]|nr:hypothetical protein [Chloroflexota bacterium]
MGRWLWVAVAAAMLVLLSGMAVSRGLTAVGVNRGAVAEVVGDNQAFVTLSGFAGSQFGLTNRYQTTGSLTNRAGAGAQVAVRVDPKVLTACRGGHCQNNASWTLYVCWSGDTAPAGTTTCGGGRQQLSFTGNGPVDPGPAQTGPLSIPAGSSGYILARVSTNASRFCAQVSFLWSGTYSSAGGFSVPDTLRTANTPGARFQVYRVGSATC